MNITVQNYKKLRPAFNLSNLDANTKEVFESVDNEINDYLELYTDSSPENDVFREVVDNHLKIVNKFLVEKSKPKKPAPKKELKTIFKSGDFVYLKEDYNSYKKGQQLEVVYDVTEDENKVDVICCGGRVQKAFTIFDLSVLSKTKLVENKTSSKKETKKIKPKYKVGQFVDYKIPLLKNKKSIGEITKVTKVDYGGIVAKYTIETFFNDKNQVHEVNENDIIKPADFYEKPIKQTSPCDDAIETYLENKKEERQKASAKAKRNRIKNALDQENVNYYNAEFRLLRRFYNLVKKEKATFRTVQLLYMAFQKHSVTRKIRKTSELANLYEICNKKLVKIYKEIELEKNNVEIEFQDKELLKQLEKLVSNKKVDYAISLMNRVINIQGTAPDDKKVERLIVAIENAFKSGKVDERSRLYEDLEKATKELKKYLNDKIEKIPAKNYGLSGVKKKM